MVILVFVKRFLAQHIKCAQKIRIYWAIKIECYASSDHFPPEYISKRATINIERKIVSLSQIEQGNE